MPQRNVTCVAPIGAILGEGPCWSADEQALWFVDIKGHKIHRYDAGTHTTTSWNAPSPPGWILPSKDDQGKAGWLVGLKTGLYRFDPDSGQFSKLHDVEADLPNNRLNDACVDPNGRLWFGTMDDLEADDTGRIYRFESNQIVDAGLAPVCITNGPAVSPDGKTLYHTDTLGGVIYASRLSSDGTLSHTQALIQIPSSDGYPDGPIVDKEGRIWTGLFAGGAVRLYSPTGELLEVVTFPVANITKLAFGGPDLTTLYATTASKGLDAAAKQAQPLAGGLFSFELDVGGFPAPAIRL